MTDKNSRETKQIKGKERDTERKTEEPIRA
jgi:hypothetical protein